MLTEPLFRYASYTFGILGIGTFFKAINDFNQIQNNKSVLHRDLVEKDLNSSVIIYHPEFGKLEKPK